MSRGNYHYGNSRNPRYRNGRAGRDQRAVSHRPPLYESQEEWRLWTEMTLRCSALPRNTTTENLYEMFSPQGNVSAIQLHGEGEASITFCPPPADAFWYTIRSLGSGWEDFRIQLQPARGTFKHRSPVHAGKTYDEHLKLGPVAIDFGLMVGKDKMMTMQTITDDLGFLLDLHRLEISLFFTLPAPTTPQEKHHYRVQLPLQELSQVCELDIEGNDCICLVFTAENPPSYYRQTTDISSTFGDGDESWREWNTWRRQTDIVVDRQLLNKTPVTLRKHDPIIDIGRWITYRINFHKASLHNYIYNQVKEVLSDYNLPVTKQAMQSQSIGPQSNSVWDIIDGDAGISSGMALLMDVSKDVIHLPWSVRYQLEACISMGCLNEFNIKRDFIQALAAMPERRACSRLEFAIEQRKPFYNPMDIFSLILPYSSALTSKRLPKHCSISRTATITPSTVHFSSPTTDMSNRILRQYKEHEDRFLRVRFTEEKGRIHWSSNNTQDPVFTRVYRCLKNGIRIGNRHYEFLAMGNSQFREHGAYFFASTPSLTAADIRARMGTFDDIQIVAKWASRLGQCFSTTRAILSVGTVKLVEIEDINRNGYCFTDGVGKISRFVAQMIASELGLSNASHDPPSVFQIRLGGIKGVLAIAPEATGNEVHIRESQYKFPALYQGLEVIRCAAFTHVILNRQLLSILTWLGISNDIFLRKMQTELSDLQEAMHDKEVALRKLQERIDINQTSLTIAGMIFDGFMEDPFVLSILHLWRSWVTKALKDKAGIAIKDGAFVLGCTDETETLLGHFEAAQQATYDNMDDRIRALPQIFIQVDPLRKGQYRIIEGLCLVARNPSLHPGDIRVVRAVNNHRLHHLKNVVVFPQSGDRDLPNMCSGGDLDGDDFVVIWDQELIPKPSKWSVPAMNFKAAAPEKLDRAVNIQDVIPFFVKYIKTDSLRTIATSHLASADFYPDGAGDPRCLQLAELHSIAVDYSKSGIPAIMPHRLRPPQRPHFMASRYRNRPGQKVYRSKTILGQLFDMVKEVDFVPLVHLPFDKRILDAYPNSQLAHEALELKAEYDAAMRRIMAQHGIATEFEVWTAFVLAHSGLTNDYMFPQELGRIVSSLQERFKEAIYEKCGGREFALIAPFVATMYAVTAQEVDLAVQQLRIQMLQVSSEYTDLDGAKIEAKDLPLLSFPWLFHRELGLIANGQRPPGGMTERMPAQLLEPTHVSGRSYQAPGTARLQGDIVTADGVTHSGEVLKMFDHHGSSGNADDYEVVGDETEDQAMEDNWLDSFTTPSTRFTPSASTTTLRSRPYLPTATTNLAGSSTWATAGTSGTPSIVTDDIARNGNAEGDPMVVDGGDEAEEGEVVEQVTITEEPSALDELLEMLG